MMILILFAITAAGVVPCGGTKNSPRTSSIVQIIFYFWSVGISEGILRNPENIFIRLDSFSYQSLIYLAPFGLQLPLHRMSQAVESCNIATLQ